MLVCSVCVALLYFRRPNAFHMPQFYAEDGRDFFADAYNDGWKSLTYTVNGYPHLYPRIVDNVALAVGVQLVHMPAVHMIGCLLMYLALWTVVFMRFPGAVWMKSLAVAATVLPPLGNEIWMNMTNVQWPMALLLFILVAGPPLRARIATAVVAVLLVLCIGTGPNVLVLLPALLINVWTAGRAGQDRPMWRLAAVCIGAAVIGVSLWGHGSVQRTDGAFEPLDIGFVQALFYQFAYPLLSTSIHTSPIWLGALVLSGLALGWSWLLWKLPAEGRMFPWSCAAMALSYMLVTLISYRGDPGFLSPFHAGIRNFYLPTVAMAWSVIAAMDPTNRSWRVTLCCVAGWWGFQTIRIGPLTYPDQEWPRYAAEVRSGHDVDVPITPIGWSMQLRPPGRHERRKEERP